MEKCAYTIGYAHHTQESFLALLKKYQINCVIDVRTMAYSKFHPQFNKEPLKYFLNKEGILYRQMQEAFGIIRPDSLLLNEAGYLDFVKIAELPTFKEGIETIIRGIEAGYHIAFMCAEKAPSDCHRSTLVGRALKDKGYQVHHILYEGDIQTQGDLEEALLERYFPEEAQLHLFNKPNKRQLMDKAYELQSNQIVEVNSKRVLKKTYSSPKLKNKS